MRREAVAALAFLALAACGQGASKLDDEQVAKQLRMDVDSPSRAAEPRPVGRFESAVAGFDAHPLAGPAQFCHEGERFSIALLDGGRGAGYLLERMQGGAPAPGTYPVARSAYQEPGAFRGSISLVPVGQQEPDDFLVTGGELVVAAVDGERVEGSFRVEVRSQELEETVPGAPPADTTNATRATVSGTFQATKRCLGDA